MPNGRCFQGGRYESLSVTNRNDEEQCEYLLKCALSQGVEKNCPCYRDSRCVDELSRKCRLPIIRYPRRAVVTRFTFFLFNPIRNLRNKQPDFIEINGTVRCRDALVTVRGKRIPFDTDLIPRQIIDEHFCGPFLSNISSSSIPSTCHHENESTDFCREWNPCLSRTRIRDGTTNCLDDRDELEQSEMEIEKSCARVRRYRFRCSKEESSCLSVTRLGDEFSECRNRFDVLWFGVGRTISFAGCNNVRQDECSLLRRYIEQSSTTKNDIQKKSRLTFRFHCDTFEDLPLREDENLIECQQWWICHKDEQRCQTGQCFEESWIDDNDWDCADASDAHGRLHLTTERTLHGASACNFTNRSFFVPSSCNESHPFLCLSSRATQQGFSCFNLSQIGDGNIDCAGAQGERNNLQHCSQSSSILGPNFLCSSTNSCIPFLFHCWRDEYRCPNRSDDEFWCDRQYRPSNCFDLRDFVCFDRRCVKGGRCNANVDCLFAEDEYMCDYDSSSVGLLIPYRQFKRFARGERPSILHLSRYLSDVNVVLPQSQSPPMISPVSPTMASLSDSLSPYWRNRGLGVLSTKNHSTILCFCPPQYYGDKCQFHSDRLSVVLHLDLSLSSSIQVNRHDRRILLQLLVIFLFNDDQVLILDQFRLHPSVEFDSLLNNRKKKRKLISHFVYPRSSTFLHQRRQRFFNRSSLLSRSSFSIRVELYQTRLNERPSIIAIWKYPLPFSHLPVSRLSKVLRFDQSSPHRSPCHSNEQCHQLMNNRSEYICLCRDNFTGENCSREDEQCLQDYCTSTSSLCQPNSRSSLRRKTSPFCLCPLNRYGPRCSIEHDACLSNTCLNNGSCFPDIELDRFICLCRKEYFGSRCEMKRSSIDFSLSIDLPYRGLVLQVLQIELSSLELILLQQRVFVTIPQQMEHHHSDKLLMTGIVVAKLYSSSEVSLADLHLLSVYENVFSIDGRTNISSINRCEHRRTFSFSEDSSPIRYHQVCINNRTRLCFRNDQYLCICADNHTRVECFNYDDQLDRCSNCLANGRCLQGDPVQLNDFVCLCPKCHSGKQCQFNTGSFSFTLDQLFSADLLSSHRQRSISLLIFFPLLGLFLSIPNNLFSFITLRHHSCLRQGVGHYLLTMSGINQTILLLLVARLIHLIVIMTISRSSPLVDDLFCKLLGYLLTCLTRLSSWLPSFVALERAYTTLFLNKQWFKQPRVARSLMLLIAIVILLSTLDELAFVKSFTSIADESSAMCVIEYPSSRRSMWISIHQVVSVSHFLFPLLINLCSTLIIISMVIKSKMNIQGNEKCKLYFPKYSTMGEFLFLFSNEQWGSSNRLPKCVTWESRDDYSTCDHPCSVDLFSLLFTIFDNFLYFGLSKSWRESPPICSDDILFHHVRSTNIHVLSLHLSVIILLERMAINNDRPPNHCSSTESTLKRQIDSLDDPRTEKRNRVILSTKQRLRSQRFAIAVCLQLSSCISCSPYASFIWTKGPITHPLIVCFSEESGRKGEGEADRIRSKLVEIQSDPSIDASTRKPCVCGDTCMYTQAERRSDEESANCLLTYACYFLLWPFVKILFFSFYPSQRVMPKINYFRTYPSLLRRLSNLISF